MQTKNRLPAVSVVMPVYNTEQYLQESIGSILNQTFSDFELLVVNDGSTDGSRELIESLQKNNKRIRLINQNNQGIVAALNNGIRFSYGKYIARMDSDDISLESRLMEQVSFMDNNADVGVCGSWCKYFGIVNGPICKVQESDSRIKASLLFNTSMVHPSIIMRRDVIEKHDLLYRNGYEHAEDYDLWRRFAQFSKLANIPKSLLYWRTHTAQVTNEHKVSGANSADKIRKELIQELYSECTADEIAVHLGICNGNFEKTIEFADKAESWFKKLLNANKRNGVYDMDSIRDTINSYWFGICHSIPKIHFQAQRKFLFSTLTHFKNVDFPYEIKFALRALLKH